MVKPLIKRPTFFAELPRSMSDFQDISYALEDWICWAEGDAPSKNEKIHFMNSVVHMLECALLSLLAPYAWKRGFGSEIFKTSEFDHYCDYATFERGYPLDMAEALGICYSLNSPWDISKEYAAIYKNELIAKLKDISIWQIEESESMQFKLNEYTKLVAESHEQKEKLNKISNGFKNSRSQRDKEILIAYFKEKNIVITKKNDLENGTFTDWPISKNYTLDFYWDCYKIAMPEVKLLPGRPKSKK